MIQDSTSAKWLIADGEMAARIRAFDWTATPLGAIGQWPQSLRAMVGLLLASPQPGYIAWGPAHTSLYNDGYIPILGGKHPAGLGKPYAELWPEIWDEYRPLVDATMAGEAQYFIDRPAALTERPGLPVSWLTFSWTPLRDENEAVAGFYCVATETTERVLAESAVHASEKRLQALVGASLGSVYRLHADWSQMRGSADGVLAGGRNRGTAWLERSVPQEARPQVRAAIREAIRSKSIFDLEHRVLRKDGTTGWAHSRAVPMLDEHGEVAEWFGAASDVTLRRQAEQQLRNLLIERETLLREGRHRVKNHLEVIDSLLDLQARAFSDARVRAAFIDASSRVHAIARIHELLSASADASEVDIKEFAVALSRSLVPAYVVAPQRVQVVVDAEPLRLDLKHAVPLGLIFNELISNSLKHAFPTARVGTVTIRLQREGESVVASVADDGIGLPDPLPAGSVGLTLIQALTEQLQGSIEFGPSSGSVVRIRFPVSSVVPALA